MRALLVAAAVVVGVLAAPAPADAATGHACRSQWQTPRSADARWCRAHGWTILRDGSTVIGPHGRIWRLMGTPGSSVIR